MVVVVSAAAAVVVVVLVVFCSIAQASKNYMPLLNE